MEDKRGTKRSCSPSKEGSSAPSSISTLSSTLSGSPLPTESPSEVSHHLRSPVFEQGGPSEKILVVDLSSYEENLIPDTPRDEEFTKRLFGNLNREILGSPDNGYVIILSDLDEEEEVHKEDTTNANAAPSSAVKSPASTVFITDANDAPKGVQDDNNDSRTPNRAQGGSSSGRDEVSLP
jgi:hypothetical protein